MLRFHTQTAGVQLTAQQPEVNLVRVAAQAIGAVLGGTQSLHTNSYDEAIALPTEKAARLALRTQQVLAYETDLTVHCGPVRGVLRGRGDDRRGRGAAVALMEQVAEYGSAVEAIEAGLPEAGDRDLGVPVAQEIDSGERVVVGVNRFALAEEDPYEPLRVDPAIEAEQAARLATLRAERDAGHRRAGAGRAERRPPRARRTCCYPMREALRARATVGRGLRRAARRLGPLPPDRPTSEPDGSRSC